MRIIQNDIKYADLAQKLYSSSFFSDAWIDGCERFSTNSLALSETEYSDLSRAAENIGFLFSEFVQIILDNSDYLDSFFNLSEYQKALFLASQGLWHGIARLDLFFLPDGSIKACEMNSDTPSGEPEAVIINDIFHFNKSYLNPNKDFESKFVNAIKFFSEYELETPPEKLNVAIIFPTEITEDLSMIELYKSWLEKAGMNVVLGSPFNLKLREKTGDLYLFEVKIDLILRHYKTDWWCERYSVWTDGFYQDELPLTEELRKIFKAQEAGKVCVFNPFGSVLTQNKLAMAFFFENIHLFSPKCQNIINEYFPKTIRLTQLSNDKIIKDSSVLKSDYGCEGDEVIIGKYASDEIWQKSLEMAVRERWVVQDFFETIKIDDNEPNFGVYLIGGKTAGIFTRLSNQSTDYYSKTIATYVNK